MAELGASSAESGAAVPAALTTTGASTAVRAADELWRVAVEPDDLVGRFRY